jgi:hypothetical protein
VSGVFQNIDPPPPIHPASVLSPHQRRGPGSEGGYTLAGRWRGVVIISEDARQGLASYSIIHLRSAFLQFDELLWRGAQVDTGYTVKRLLNDNMQNNLHSDSLEESHTRGMGSTPHHSRHITHLTTLLSHLFVFYFCVIYCILYVRGLCLTLPSLGFQLSLLFMYIQDQREKLTKFFQQQGIEPSWKPAGQCTKRYNNIN